MKTFSIACIVAMTLAADVDLDLERSGSSCRKPAANGCVYPEGWSFSSSEYEVQSAFCKQQQNWIKIKEDKTTGQFFDHIATLPLFLQDINLTFD